MEVRTKNKAGFTEYLLLKVANTTPNILEDIRGIISDDVKGIT